MRTVLFLGAGFLMLGAFVLLGRLFSGNYPGATLVATLAFVAIWLLLAGFNMWVGVAKAGYSFADELPIFLAIFAVPAAAAMVIKWKLL
jgi:hypothetical protein